MKQRSIQSEMPTLQQLKREKERCRYQYRYRQTLLSTVEILLAVAAVSILITMLWLPVYRIYGSSMTPTLQNGQIVVAAKGTNYEKGDLVAFYYGNKLLIKRIVAGPEDTVEIKKNGDIYVNGTALDERYVLEKGPGESDLEYPLRISEEHWFVLGDNRSMSSDSRSSQIGQVSQEQIVGRIVLRIWPLKDIKMFHKM